MSFSFFYFFAIIRFFQQNYLFLYTKDFFWIINIRWCISQVQEHFLISFTHLCGGEIDTGNAHCPWCNKVFSIDETS